jgi:hypothetical protein
VSASSRECASAGSVNELKSNQATVRTSRPRP